MTLHLFQKKNMSLRRFYRNVLITILVIILCFVSSAAYISFASQRSKILAHTQSILGDIKKEYKDIEKNFWALYMPIFENRDTYQGIYDYFHNQTDFTQSPIRKKNLHDIMHLMTNRDYRISWIAFYSPLRDKNYIFVASEDSLLQIDNSSLLFSDLKNKSKPMELYGAKVIADINATNYTFAIGGGVPSEMGEGSILVGYPCSIFDQYAQSSIVNEQTQYTITKDGHYIYDSFGQYSEATDGGKPLECVLGTYDYTEISSNQAYRTSFHIPKSRLYLKSCQYIPFIVIAGLALLFLALFFYSLFSNRIFKQVQSIKAGLERIGDNNLQYRLPEAHYSGELGSISRSINKMSAKLEVLIENEYLHQLKQKEAELAELQSKFDPHFLYNSLEIIRGRVYDTGDTETADIIKKLSQLFRSFVNKKRFVTIQDELAFCNSYFSLVYSPNNDNMQVVYDVDSALLRCGIIRNLLQPLVENYFIHGFDPHSGENHITIRCVEDGDNHIQIAVIDNGFGISANRLQEITASMNVPDETPQQSYGLKNLSKRIHLFYGAECGLTISNNADKGVCVSLKIRKMSCEEHETLFQKSSTIHPIH